MHPSKLSRRLSVLAVAIPLLALAVLTAGSAIGRPADPKHGGDIAFEVKQSKKSKRKVDHALFSHQDHIDAGHTCKDCHNDKIFKRERKMGVNRFSMKEIFEGKACGACHNGKTQVKGKAVFSPKRNCSRCHSVKFRKRR